MLPSRRWALTPPFHPYQALSPSAARSRALLSGPLKVFPSNGHRGTLHRRFIFCGTFRSRNLASLERSARDVREEPAPWRYQARCPLIQRPYAATFGVDIRREDHGVRTFLPAGLLAKADPAITRLARRSQYSTSGDAHFAERNRSEGDHSSRRKRAFVKQRSAIRGIRSQGLLER